MKNLNSIKQAVPLKDAAKFYGLDVRPNGMCVCPFHNDKTPSMKIYDDHFYCFGCNSHGDVIDLICGLFSLDIKEAVNKFCEDFNFSEKTEHTEKDSICPNVKDHIYRNLEKYYLRVLEEYLSLLREWKIKFRPSSPDEKYDDRFVEAVRMEDVIEHLVDVLLFGEQEQRNYLIKTIPKEVAALEEKVKTYRPVAFGNC